MGAYPFQGESAFVKNRWYIAALASEVTREPIERTILGTPVALYRAENGGPIAMYGLCPHRYYPLALGRVVGDALVCGYHGFTFDKGGKCVRIPSQDTGAGFTQPTYPLEERGPLIWIWMGERSKVDPDLLPPYSDFGLGQPGWTDCAHSHYHVKGRAQLLVDNLMDLTHLEYIHHHIAGGDVLTKTGLKAEERERSFRLERITRAPWTPFHDILFRSDNAFSGLSDMVTITDFYGPELIKTTGPLTRAIDGLDRVPAEIGDLYFMHGITPETETTCHYFGLMTRNFRLQDSEFDQLLLDMDGPVRNQDVDAIEAVERRLDHAAAIQKELLAKADAPAMKVRQKIQAMLDAETD